MSSEKTIEITGSTYEVNVIDLTDDEFDRLVSALENGDPWEGNEDLEERINEFSLINGYNVEDGRPLLEINVDGDEIPLERFDVDFDCVDEPAPELKSHQLVLEKWCRNSSETLEVSDGFDLESLELSTEECLLPTGTKRLVVTAYYEGDELEFQGSWTESIDIYIVKKDGEIIQVE